MTEAFVHIDALHAVLCAACGYLIGSFQTAIVISKYVLRDDVRKHGSGNAGSTNMVRVFGLKPGAVTFLGDFVKAVAGVLIGRLIADEPGGYIAGLFVVIAHCWPVFSGLRGGKGVASTFAIIWMTFPHAAIAVTAVGIAILLVWRRISVVSLSGVLLFTVLTFVFRFQTDLPLCVLASLLCSIVYVRHIDNIKRILKGEEKPILLR